MTIAPEGIKSCCAAAYSTEAARFLLGDSFHPGGAALTSRLIASLRVSPGSTVVDVASGLGTSALQLARESGAAIVGVDLSPTSVAAATQAARAAGLSERVRFLQGDAEALPLEDETMDGALCECALCTFPDKDAAARELARVLRPGARLALADMTAEAARLPPELTSLQAWIACIADARPLEEITELLRRAGLIVEQAERHDDALERLLERVDGRLRAARLVGANLIGDAVARGHELVAAARAALAGGDLGYGVIIARRR
jgi:ubiquinone/menaquinone biosynthesis C-methylase UbiE